MNIILNIYKYTWLSSQKQFIYIFIYIYKFKKYFSVNFKKKNTNCWFFLQIVLTFLLSFSMAERGVAFEWYLVRFKFIAQVVVCKTSLLITIWQILYGIY